MTTRRHLLQLGGYLAAANALPGARAAGAAPKSALVPD